MLIVLAKAEGVGFPLRLCLDSQISSSCSWTWIHNQAEISKNHSIDQESAI
jgi:hypothetical protein